MPQTVLFIKLLLVHYTTQNWVEIKANCNQDVSLMCPYVDNMTFLSVAWYKLKNNKKFGIIRMGKNDTSPQQYKFVQERKAMFGEKYSLILPSVTQNDSGQYECTINANVGGQNLNRQINLNVSECVTPTEVATTPVFNTSDSTTLGHREVQDLPVTWSVIGCVTVGLTKIILSLISIWVIRIGSSRRRQRTW